MSAEPGPRPLPQQPADRPRTQHEEDERSEAFGIVTVARHVKDDGRALILYTRGSDEPTADGHI